MTRIPATSSTTPGMKKRRPRLRTNDLLMADLPLITTTRITSNTQKTTIQVALHKFKYAMDIHQNTNAVADMPRN